MKKHKPKKPCSIQECPRVHEAKGYCDFHYYQLWKHGEVISTPAPKINLQAPRRAIYKDDYVKIPVIANGKVKYAMVDKAFQYLEEYKWHLNSLSGYVQYSGRSNGKVFHRSMHRIIYEAHGGDKLVYHIDGNKLNNRHNNLSILSADALAHKISVGCHSSQRRVSLKTSSQYRGVHRGKKTKAWRSSISFHGRSHYLGSFKTEEDAYKAYLSKRAELMT